LQGHIDSHHESHDLPLTQDTTGHPTDSGHTHAQNTGMYSGPFSSSWCVRALNIFDKVGEDKRPYRLWNHPTPASRDGKLQEGASRCEIHRVARAL